MKRTKRLTKRQRKQAAGTQPGGNADRHIHCIACGRHIFPEEFSSTPVGARILRCQHGTTYTACSGCVEPAQAMLREHDRTGARVSAAAPWH